MSTSHHHLPRLETNLYQGFAIVHWTFTIDKRVVGWLDELMHSRIRELLVHTLGRYRLMCPAYCLMPDHMHLIVMGVSETSDQLKATLFLRRHLNALLKPHHVQLQKQAYDHILREHEREQGAFEKVAWYILENPVRAGLVESRDGWNHSGCVVLGHPGWNVFHNEYWPAFWTEYNDTRTKSHGLSPAATKVDEDCSRR